MQDEKNKQSFRYIQHQNTLIKFEDHLRVTS